MLLFTNIYYTFKCPSPKRRQSVIRKSENRKVKPWGGRASVISLLWDWEAIFWFEKLTRSKVDDH